MKIRLVVLLILASLGLRLWWTVETESPLGGPVAEVVIPQGTSSQGVADLLLNAGVLKRSWSFMALVRLDGNGAKLKAGRYRFDGPYSMRDIEQKLVEGDVERRSVTFPEGRNIFDMAEIATRVGLSEAAFLAAARDASAIADLDPGAKTLEGYLFPETYDVKDGADEAALVRDMVKNTRAVFTELGLTPEGRTIRGIPLNLREIVTLASIVEMETAAPAERPRIAGVFLNRLAKRMILQTDPTVIYALKLAGRYDGNIRKADLSNDSPYNTYRFPGLPPGPIASPGRAALTAVLQPEETDAIYFVSRNDGTHVFSESLRDHERAVDQFQRRRASRNAAAARSPSPAAVPSASPRQRK